MRLREHEGIKEGKLDMLRADPRHLIVQPDYNVRDLTTPDAVEKLKELAASIAENGVTNPLVVRFDAEGEKIIVIEGHRRLAATLMAIEAGADIKSVPIYQQPNRINDADRDLGLIISNSGEPLTQLEKAKVIGRLVAHGWTPDEIRKKCGWKSNATVAGYLDMLAMPADLQKAVKNGEVSATVARRLEAEQPGLAAKIIADAAEEQKRLGKKHRATPKAIAKATGKKPTDKLPIPKRAPRQSETQEPASSVALATAAPTERQLLAAEQNGAVVPPSYSDLLMALAIIVANARKQPDASMGRTTDVYAVPLDDIEAAGLLIARATGGEG